MADIEWNPTGIVDDTKWAVDEETGDFLFRVAPGASALLYEHLSSNPAFYGIEQERVEAAKGEEVTADDFYHRVTHYSFFVALRSYFIDGVKAED